MTDVPLRVLMVEDNQSDAKLLERELHREGLEFSSTRVETEPKYIEALATEPHLVLCDWQLPQFNSIRALELLRERWPNTPFILVSGFIGEEAAVQIIKMGANDCLLKHQLSRLVPSIKQALINRSLKQSAQQALAALKESELRYRMLFESNPHPMWVYDLETLRFLAVNETAIRDYGYTREEFLGMTIRDIRPAEDIPRLEQALAQLSTASTRPRIWRLRRKDGSIFNVEISSNTYTENGRPARLALALDVTERTKAEAALLESEERFRLAILATNDAVWSFDVASGTVHWSERYTTAFGRPPETASSWQWWIDQIHPDDRERTTNSLRKVIDGTASHWSGEYRFLRADGEWADIHDQAHIARDHEMKATKIVGAMRDVTERNRADRELRRTSELLRAIVEGTTDAIFAKDLTGKYLLFNEAAARFVGKSVAEVVGRADFELFGDVDSAKIRANDARVIATGEIVTHEEVLTAAGVTRTYLATKGPYRDGSGKIIGVLGISRDITERLHAETERRRLAENYAHLFERAAIGIFQSTVEGRYKSLNITFAQIFGYGSSEEMIAIVSDIGTQIYVDTTLRQDYLRQLIKSDAMVEFECECRRKDGTTLTVRQNTRAVRDPSGTLLYFEGFVQDVTERNRVQSELMLRDRAMQVVTQGILISDAQQQDNPIIYASPGFETLTGYKAFEVIGKSCGFLQGKESDPSAINEISTALKSAQTCHVEIRNYRKDGTPFWNELTISPVLNSAGVLTHFVGIQIDVTARRSLEEQLRQSQKLEAVGLLAGGIAHDFNNLLTVINGYSELLADNLAPGDYGREPLLAIRDAGERAAALTSQLLAFSRKAIVEPKILDLHDVVESVGRLLRRLIGEDINLIIDRIGSRAHVLIDPGQVEQIIMNLAVNARDAMPLGGTIKITTAKVHIDEMPNTSPGEFKAGDYVQMTVTDSGTGMSEDVRNRAFEPFFTTKEVGKGTGLGLSTVYGIVRQAGGHISIDSTLGSGTTIRLLFPALPASTAIEQPGSHGTTQPGTETLLLVEDEDRVRLLARLGLELQGYKVIEAESGVRAIAASKSYAGQIHMLVTDMIMPGLSGREVAEAVRATRPGIQVLYMSGYLDDAVARHGIETSNASFMQKPFTPLSLARKVREILDYEHTRQK
jgi:two-component system, cell cycle sensor histidine kinase and response regulator CckA